MNDSEDLELVFPMYNWLEYSTNYSDTTGSLWFYSKDKATNFNANIVDTNDLNPSSMMQKLLRNTEVD